MKLAHLCGSVRGKQHEEHTENLNLDFAGPDYYSVFFGWGGKT